MATEVMTAPEGRIIHKTYAVLSGAAIPQRVHVTQYDESLPVIACTLYKDGQLYTIPDGASVRLRMNKNGLPVYHEAIGIDDARHVVYLEITAQMTVLYGEFAMVIEVETSDGKTAGTSYLRLIVRQNPVQNPELDNIPDYTANSNRLTAEGVKKLQDESSTQQKAIEDKGKNTLESIPADYRTLSGKVDENTSRISELKEDLGELSVGNYIISPNYHSGKINPSTGEEVAPYDTARISEKLNFDNYESVIVGTTASEDSGYWLYISVFEFDSSGKYIKQIANTLDKYTIIPTNGHLYVLQWWYGDSNFENRLPYTKVLAKSLLNKKDKEKIYTDLSPKTEVKLDLPDKLFIVKGETLELFKYGMYYTDTEFINNQYNIRVVNIDEYATQYDDKIVISCPDNYSKPILQGDYDLALFQLINTYGRVIEQKRVKIFVVDKATISDIDRNIMYIGDSFTGMGFRTQEIANLIAKESNLTKTKLIGRSIGQGSGNRFTGTGGYSWANYTENPNTLPNAYPNNYLWDPAYNHISMYYLVNSLRENHLDYVVILLGWNDYENSAFASYFNWDIMKQRAKKLIENIHNFYPACKIILESYHYMYPFHRKSYGGALPQVRQNKYIYDLNRFYQEIANEYEYVEFVQMSIQIDVLHNMGFEEEKANKRSEEIVKYCKDVVHPADIGFYQYSDAEFNALLYLMQ